MAPVPNAKFYRLLSELATERVARATGQYRRATRPPAPRRQVATATGLVARATRAPWRATFDWIEAMARIIVPKMKNPESFDALHKNALFVAFYAEKPTDRN